MGLVHGDPARVTPTVRGSHANASMEVYDAESDSWALVPDSWLSGNKVRLHGSACWFTHGTPA